MGAMLYRLMADILVILHLGFVAFVVLGGFLVVFRPNWAWIHIPAATWGALIEFTGWICPLTPLEVRFRVLGGEAGYSGGFVEHYLLPLLYPGGLTRTHQLALGAIVVLLNLAVYGWAWSRWRKKGSRKGSSPISGD